MYDVIVIGAGVNGLSAGYYLAAKEKKKVLLIEQFPFPHSRGSSTGHSRITRQCYREKHFCNMMREAMPLWDEIEKLSGLTLYKNCGLLLTGPPESIDSCEQSMKTNNFTYKNLSYAEMAAKFPQFSGFDDSERFIYDPSGGVLLADKCLRALQKLFIEHDGEFHENETVLSINPKSNSSVVVSTNSGQYESTSVIVATNAWTKQIMGRMGVDIPIDNQKVTVTYWRLKDVNNKSFHVDSKCPTFMTTLNNAHIYGLPELEYPGCIKFCNHHGETTSPDNRDWASHDQKALSNIKAFISRYLPQVHSEPAIVETCIYSNSPDGSYIIDRHPEHSQVIFAAGFCGTGFKTGPVVGKILSCMALNKQSGYDLSIYRLNRFQSTRAKL